MHPQVVLSHCKVLRQVEFTCIVMFSRVLGVALFLALTCLAESSYFDVEKEVERKVYTEHPPYTLTDDQPKDGSYEVRRYASGEYVRTRVVASDYMWAKKAMFHRLFDYFEGKNNRGIRMDFTVPVMSLVYGQPCAVCKSRNEMWFYIPLLYHSDAPKPTNGNVTFQHFDAYTTYVRQFHGDVSETQAKFEANKLYEDMVRNKVAGIKTTNFIVAEYNRYNSKHRYNEIWMFLKTKGRDNFF